MSESLCETCRYGDTPWPSCRATDSVTVRADATSHVTSCMQWQPREGEPQPQQRKENAVATSGTYLVEVVRVKDGWVMDQLLSMTTLECCHSDKEAEYRAIAAVVSGRPKNGVSMDWKGVVVNVTKPFRD